MYTTNIYDDESVQKIPFVFIIFGDLFTTYLAVSLSKYVSSRLIHLISTSESSPAFSESREKYEKQR